MEMKLSKTGLERISKPILKFLDGYYDYAVVETLEDHKFESDDFEGVVVLTLAEAKILRYYAIEFYTHQSHLSDDFEELIDDFQERITQAESSMK